MSDLLPHAELKSWLGVTVPYQYSRLGYLRVFPSILRPLLFLEVIQSVRVSNTGSSSSSSTIYSLFAHMFRNAAIRISQLISLGFSGVLPRV